MFGRRAKNRRQPQGPQVDRLSSAEVVWRDDQLAVAAQLAERYTGASEPLPTLERLDACIAGWRADGDDRVDVNSLINAVGVAFGTHLARDTDLEWVIATDEKGSDLALHGEPGNILLFPTTAVAKRVTAGEVGFIVSLHNGVVGTVDQLRARN